MRLFERYFSGSKAHSRDFSGNLFFPCYGLMTLLKACFKVVKVGLINKSWRTLLMANLSAQALDNRWETESYTSDYFEPDIMLPDQYNARRVAGVDGGERKLMAALLSDGVQAYLDQAVNLVRGGGNSRIDAIEWVENKDPVYIFSFDNVCAGLGINPEYLRVGLARYILNAKNRKKGVEPFPVWKRIRRPRKR